MARPLRSCGDALAPCCLSIKVGLTFAGGRMFFFFQGLFFFSVSLSLVPHPQTNTMATRPTRLGAGLQQQTIESGLNFGGVFIVALGIVALAIGSSLWISIFVVALCVFLVLCSIAGTGPYSTRRDAALDGALLMRLFDRAMARIGPTMRLTFDAPMIVAEHAALADRNGNLSACVELPLYAVCANTSHVDVYTRDQIGSRWPGLFGATDGIDPASVLFPSDMAAEDKGLSIVVYRTTRTPLELDLFSADPTERAAALAHIGAADTMRSTASVGALPMALEGHWASVARLMGWSSRPAAPA
jgi:hypothetical protein